MTNRPRAYHTWNFDIDRFLNPLIPSPPWNLLPYPVAHFLGYRKAKPASTGNLMPIFWSFIGIFCAIVIIQAVSVHIPSFEKHHAPAIVGSFGATAVLEFYAIESPLAQPRNVFFGQVLSSVVGVGVARLFLLSGERFEDVRYLGGALACAAATAVMGLTGSVHPPAGATALLAVVDSRLVGLGWFLVPVMALGCALMTAVALLINNLERRFPVYWWTPNSLRPKRSLASSHAEQGRRLASGAAAEKTADTTSDGAESAAAATVIEERQGSSTVADVDHRGCLVSQVIIRPGRVLVPGDMHVTQAEMQLLETLSKRL